MLQEDLPPRGRESIAASGAERCPQWAVTGGHVGAVALMAALVSVLPHLAFQAPGGWTTLQNAAFIRCVHAERERESGWLAHTGGGNALGFKPPPMRPGHAMPVEYHTVLCSQC